MSGVGDQLNFYICNNKKLLRMDFRLSVFISVARNLNFTRAANELHVSQPAISRHIQELETAYQTQLFERSGGKIRLTPSGEVFLKHAEVIMENYKALKLEMNLLNENFAGELRVGASTTIAQYVLPPAIARFIAMYPDIRLSVITGNTEQIEQALTEHKIDVGLIEGKHRRHDLRYTHFKKDELVLVTNIRNKTADEVTVEDLSYLPLVLRETGSGTLEVLEEALAVHGKKLTQMNILLQLGSTESIKLFLENSASVFAIVSIAAVSRELMNNKMKVVEVTGLELEREFAFVTSLGAQNELQKCFVRFLMNNQ